MCVLVCELVDWSVMLQCTGTTCRVTVLDDMNLSVRSAVGRTTTAVSHCRSHLPVTIRYGLSNVQTDSQLSLPHGMNKNVKEKKIKIN